jgi:hypothetical protein
MKTDQRSFFPEVRRIRRDFGQVACLTGPSFSFKTVNLTISRAESAFLEDVESLFDFFFEFSLVVCSKISGLEIFFLLRHFYQGL